MTGLAAALGFFDGVHLGHAALLRRAAAEAAARGLESAVITLDRYPAGAVGGEPAPLINSAADREYLIRVLYGIEKIVSLCFDDALIATPWQSFADMLIDGYDCRALVCGYDYRFGAHGEGSSALLAQYARRRGAECVVVPRVALAPCGTAVSSTEIRGLIERGDMREATRLLGHPQLIGGTVIHGRRLGHSLGFPTINLSIPNGVIRPAFGVYVSRVTLDGTDYGGVTNIGVKPTVTDEGTVTAETYLFDYGADAYGKTARLWLLERIRPEQKFDSLDKLSLQMRRDAEKARVFLDLCQKSD